MNISSFSNLMIVFSLEVYPLFLCTDSRLVVTIIQGLPPHCYFTSSIYQELRTLLHSQGDAIFKIDGRLNLVFQEYIRLEVSNS